MFLIYIKLNQKSHFVSVTPLIVEIELIAKSVGKYWNTSGYVSMLERSFIGHRVRKSNVDNLAHIAVEVHP